MTLPASPPRYASWAEMLLPIRATASGGWPVYAVQRVVGAEPDGFWGKDTEQRARSWQSIRGLKVDGVFGPVCQGTALREAAAISDNENGLPELTTYGFAHGEGADIFAATNFLTPAGAPPGCDCGAEQRRRQGPPFAHGELLQSFDPEWALRNCGRELRQRQIDYMKASPSQLGRRPWLALDVAVLAHNAPFLALQIVRKGRLLTPDAPAQWTNKPGGGHYTHREWRYHYPATILQFIAGHGA